VRERLCNPRVSAEQYRDNLEKQALVETVSMLRAYEAVI
jgi:hypothetical protein